MKQQRTPKMNRLGRDASVPATSVMRSPIKPLSAQVVVEHRIGKSIHRLRTNGPAAAAEKAALAAGWQSVVVFPATERDLSLPYVYELGDSDY